MWQRFKLAWRIVFNAEQIRIVDLQAFLNLLPDKPKAKKKNLGGKWLVEFIVPIDRPDSKKLGTWGRANA